MTNNPKLLVPSQRAVSEAADWLESPDGGGSTRLVEHIRGGRRDDHPLVQAFARFEQELTAEKVDRESDMREMLRQAMNALACSDKNDPLEPIADNGMTVWDGMRSEYERLRPYWSILLAEISNLPAPTQQEGGSLPIVRALMQDAIESGGDVDAASQYAAERVVAYFGRRDGLEPKGCPTPGACSCLPTQQEGLAHPDDNVVDTIERAIIDYERGVRGAPGDGSDSSAMAELIATRLAPPVKPSLTDEREAIAHILEQALIERNVPRFEVITFVNRHEIIAALRHPEPVGLREALALVVAHEKAAGTNALKLESVFGIAREALSGRGLS